MNKMENTSKNNRLIAEFMGQQIITDVPERMKYHASWNWLMPVVDKIEAISTPTYYGFTVDIRRNHCAIFCHEKGRMDGIIFQTPYGTGETKIKSVYDAVVFFTNWHNENNNIKITE